MARTTNLAFAVVVGATPLEHCELLAEGQILQSGFSDIVGKTRILMNEAARRWVQREGQTR